MQVSPPPPPESRRFFPHTLCQVEADLPTAAQPRAVNLKEEGVSHPQVLHFLTLPTGTEVEGCSWVPAALGHEPLHTHVQGACTHSHTCP